MASGSERASRRQGKTSALALTLAVATAGAVAVANTDNLVESGFVSALERPDAGSVQHTARVSVPVAASEDVWLSPAGSPGAPSSGEVSLASWHAPVKLGADVTLSIGGEQRVLQVFDIAELQAGTTRVDTSSAGSRLVMVSLRDAGKPHGAVVRFIVEGASPSMLQIAVAPPRAL